MKILLFASVCILVLFTACSKEDSKLEMASDGFLESSPIVDCSKSELRKGSWEKVQVLDVFGAPMGDEELSWGLTRYNILDFSTRTPKYLKGKGFRNLYHGDDFEMNDPNAYRLDTDNCAIDIGIFMCGIGVFRYHIIELTENSLILEAVTDVSGLDKIGDYSLYPLDPHRIVYTQVD